MRPVDVIVIGAGIIGAAVAEALALRGARVRVLEMRAAGGGASWASAGLLAPYTEAQPSSPLLAMGVRSLAMYDDFIARVCERSGRTVEYSRTGTLEVAMTPESAVRLCDSVEAFSASDAGIRWMNPDDVRNLEPSVTRSIHGAAFVTAHGFVGVQSLVGALVQSARVAGASFETPVQATAVELQANGVTVSAGDRRLSADHVVLAAGTWSSRIRIAEMPPLPVRPVRGQLLRLGWNAGDRPAHVVWTDDCYIVPWSDGTVLVGATSEEVGFDESTTAAGVHELIAAAIRALPGAASSELLDVRAGLRPASADGLPYIGRRRRTPHVTYATGHFRNGILLAPLTAAVTASAVLDEATDDVEQWTSPNRLDVL
jgi:glycine oxidase